MVYKKVPILRRDGWTQGYWVLTAPKKGWIKLTRVASKTFKNPLEFPPVVRKGSPVIPFKGGVIVPENGMSQDFFDSAMRSIKRAGLTTAWYEKRKERPMFEPRAAVFKNPLIFNKGKLVKPARFFTPEAILKQVEFEKIMPRTEPLPYHKVSPRLEAVTPKEVREKQRLAALRR